MPPMTIYIDPSDASLQAALELATGAQIKLSSDTFKGGTRAIISSRSILIDNSFEQKLQEARNGFTLAGK